LDLLPMYSRPNWDFPANAKYADDAKQDGFSTIFTTIFQAHLPNPGNRPLTVDLQAHKSGANSPVLKPDRPASVSSPKASPSVLNGAAANQSRYIMLNAPL